MAFKAFDRVVSLSAGSADDRWLAGELAAAAKAALSDAQQTGEAPRELVRAVNARRDLAEEQVKMPGAIVYTFDWTRHAVAFALDYLRISSPRRSGRYIRSFVVISQGRETQIDAIALGQGALVVDTQPYSRKIQIGAKGFERYRGLYEKARSATLREFRGLVTCRVKFVELSGAYRLKRGSGNRRRGDRRAGARVTYPALEILSEHVLAS